MGEKAVGRIKPFAASGFDGMAEMHGVPVDDDGGEQVEARDPVVLALPSRTHEVTHQMAGSYSSVICDGRSMASRNKRRITAVSPLMR